MQINNASKVKSQKRPIKPWITRGLRVSIKKKNALFQISKEISDQEFTDEYKTYRNLLTLLKNKSHDNYYREKLSQHGQNKSKTWLLINEITQRKRNRSCSIKCMVNEDKVKLEDSASIADCLNNHFGTVGQKLASKLDSENVKTKDPLEYIQNRYQTLFSYHTQMVIRFYSSSQSLILV